LGMGIYGYNRLAPEYMGEEIRGKVEYRSVHSMWFQALGEVGWIGLFIFLGMLYSLWRISSKTKQFLIAKEDYAAYFKLLALECALLGYMAAASFINRFRAEILYWFILFLAVGVKLYYLQCRDAQEVETSARKKLVRD